MCGPVQLKTGVCERKNGNCVGCAGKNIESQAPLCVCAVRERERGAGASGPELNANTAFGIRGGVCKDSRSSNGMGFISIKVRLH